MGGGIPAGVHLFQSPQNTCSAEAGEREELADRGIIVPENPQHITKSVTVSLPASFPRGSPIGVLPLWQRRELLYALELYLPAVPATGITADGPPSKVTSEISAKAEATKTSQPTLCVTASHWREPPQ